MGHIADEPQTNTPTARQPKASRGIALRPNDPRIIAVQRELLHAHPELTGSQINSIAFVAVATIERIG